MPLPLARVPAWHDRGACTAPLVGRYINGSAYDHHVTLDNGTQMEFTKRERPHLVFAPDGMTPLALTNGAGIDGIGQYVFLLAPHRAMGKNRLCVLDRHYAGAA